MCKKEECIMCKMIHYKDGKYIADIKQKYIFNIVKQAELCENICRIMLFGSSLEERCTDESDIDIAVFGKQSKNKYLQSKEFKNFQDQLLLYDLNQDYDILYFADNVQHNYLILQDINNGVEIYRRNQA